MATRQKGLIVSNSKILNGKPIVKGTRISVALILQNVASGMTKEDILHGYPTLTKEGLNAALDFAAREHVWGQTPKLTLSTTTPPPRMGRDSGGYEI